VDDGGIDKNTLIVPLIQVLDHLVGRGRHADGPRFNRFSHGQPEHQRIKFLDGEGFEPIEDVPKSNNIPSVAKLT
jgi:hypothetical protein